MTPTKLIAKGGSRSVFSHPDNPNAVVKHDKRRRQNPLEYRVWNICEQHDLPLNQWLAPCFSLSHDSLILVQARTTPVTEWPTEIPVFFTDLDVSNFGMYDGRFVCHDYAFNHAWKHGFSVDMKKAMFSTLT